MSELQQTLNDILSMEGSMHNRYSYIAIEKLVLVMLEDYIKKQKKEFVAATSRGYNRYEFDGYAPEGFDDYQGKTAIEIKFFRQGRVLKNVINDIVNRAIHNDKQINNLVIIVLSPNPVFPNKLTYSCDELSNVRVDIWDVNDLEKIILSNIELYNQTLSNLNSILLRETISNSVKTTRQLDLSNRDKHIRHLQKEYASDNLVLFLGAGASKDANIATWNNLISKLFVALINKMMAKDNKTITKEECDKIVDSLIKQKDQSPLLQARLLRRGLETDFENLIRDILYKDAKNSSDLLKELAQLCVPNRGKIGIQAIINYNFDDLIEKNLKRLRVKYHSIYAEGMIADSDEIGIYHVHGFLPQDKGEYKDLTKSLLVFSEEGYHKLLLEPYNWANFSQLNFLINHCCVFIGLSMTDPNLRRLLEIAAQKQMDGDTSCKHYAILKKDKIEDSATSEGLSNFEKVNASLQESLYQELDVNIIWIDDYPEIPDILRKIKAGMETNV